MRSIQMSMAGQKRVCIGPGGLSKSGLEAKRTTRTARLRTASTAATARAPHSTERRPKQQVRGRQQEEEEEEEDMAVAVEGEE